MHEWGLVDELVKKVIAEAEKHKLKKVTKIFLALGKDDHITAENLNFIFQSLAKDTLADKSKLEIKQFSGKGIILESIEGEN